MINLLTEDHKRNLKAARQNVILRRYVIALIVTILVAAAAFATGYTMMIFKRNEAKSTQQSNQSIIDEHKTVAEEASAFASNLTSAKAILGSEILFSNLMVDIAKTLPKGSVLSNLNITTDNIGAEPISLSARTVDAGKTPIQLKNDLEASPLFENVSIESITRTPVSEDSSEIARRYPVTVVLTVTLTKEAGSQRSES